MSFKQIQIRARKSFFTLEGGKTPAQVAQRVGGCPILGNIQVGWDSNQPGLVGSELGDLLRSFAIQTIL